MRTGLALLALAAVLTGIGGCASTGARREEELAVLAARLPGDYDNLAQVKLPCDCGSAR
jgi:hypothetical protein